MLRELYEDIVRQAFATAHTLPESPSQEDLDRAIASVTEAVTNQYQLQSLASYAKEKKTNLVTLRHRAERGMYRGAFRVGRDWIVAPYYLEQAQVINHKNDSIV